MGAIIDYYRELGVSRHASREDIRKAWLQLVRRYHPDLNPGDKQAEAKTKRINEAYDVLSNDEKRKLYDEHGSYWLRHWQRRSRPADSRPKKAPETGSEHPPGCGCVACAVRRADGPSGSQAGGSRQTGGATGGGRASGSRAGSSRPTGGSTGGGRSSGSRAGSSRPTGGATGGGRSSGSRASDGRPTGEAADSSESGWRWWTIAVVVFAALAGCGKTIL